MKPYLFMAIAVIGVLMNFVGGFKGLLAETGFFLVVLGFVGVVILLIGEGFMEIAERFGDKQQHN